MVKLNAPLMSLDASGTVANSITFAKWKGRNYAAVVRWIEAGRPVRSDREIEQIIRICERCVHYMNNHCRLCGCRLRGSSALFSKIRMATEHCPIGKW